MKISICRVHKETQVSWTEVNSQGYLSDDTRQFCEFCKQDDMYTNITPVFYAILIAIFPGDPGLTS